MKLGPILLLISGGETLKTLKTETVSEFEQSGALAGEDIFITDGKTSPYPTLSLTAVHFFQ
jgi:hypothetical protein